jgi:hypothetical protein
MSERDAFVVRTTAELSEDMIEVIVTLDLPPGVHLEPNQPAEPYLIPTVLDIEDLEDVTVMYPSPVIKDLGWRGVALTVLEGRLTFLVRGRVQDGMDRVRGTLSYQPCVGGACLPPRTVPWESPMAGTTTYSILRAVAAKPF